MSEGKLLAEVTSIRTGFVSLQAAQAFHATLAKPENFFITRVVQDVFQPESRVVGYLVEEKTT